MTATGSFESPFGPFNKDAEAILQSDKGFRAAMLDAVKAEHGVWVSTLAL